MAQNDKEPCADSCLILTLTERPLSMRQYCHLVFMMRNSNQWDQAAGAPVLYIVGGHKQEINRKKRAHKEQRQIN